MTATFRLKDLEALGLTKARAEILVRATDPAWAGRVTEFGIPGETLKALVKHGYAEWMLVADETTQQALRGTRDGYITAARADLLKEPPDWKHALTCLHGADNHERDATRRELRLTPKGLEFAQRWKERTA